MHPSIPLCTCYFHVSSYCQNPLLALHFRKRKNIIVPPEFPCCYPGFELGSSNALSLSFFKAGFQHFKYLLLCMCFNPVFVLTFTIALFITVFYKPLAPVTVILFAPSRGSSIGLGGLTSYQNVFAFRR